ncbi:MAG: acetylglutamate kinase [Flavitalea sp.]
MNKLYVIKIGGNIIDDASNLSSFLKEFANLPGKKILVHGGGKRATRLADQLGIPQQMVDGRRITDQQTLEIVTMVYAGSINKNIVSQLQQYSCNAIGLTGADGNAITAHKRIKKDIDYGFAGDIDTVNTSFISHLLEGVNTIVLAPITHDGNGQLLNTNADTIAQEMATAMSQTYEVNLVYVFEKAGVLLDTEDDATVIPHLDPPSYEDLKSRKLIFAGMIPKLDNAFAALDKGVSRVIIGKSQHLEELANGRNGTLITNSHVSAQN